MSGVEGMTALPIHAEYCSLSTASNHLQHRIEEACMAQIIQARYVNVLRHVVVARLSTQHNHNCLAEDVYSNQCYRYSITTTEPALTYLHYCLAAPSKMGHLESAIKIKA